MILSFVCWFRLWVILVCMSPPEVKGDVLFLVQIPLASASALLWHFFDWTLNRFFPNLQRYFSGTCIRAEQVLVCLTFFSRWDDICFCLGMSTFADQLEAIYMKWFSWKWVGKKKTLEDKKTTPEMPLVAIQIAMLLDSKWQQMYWIISGHETVVGNQVTALRHSSLL